MNVNKKNQYFKVIKYMNTLRVSPSVTDVPMMCTRAKMQIFARNRHIFQYNQKKTENILCNFDIKLEKFEKFW